MIAQDHVFPEVNSLQWGLMNQRRAELIRKKNRQGLTDAEHAEYERLQILTHAALEKAFPRLPLDDGIIGKRAQSSELPEPCPKQVNS